jgi:hypothetical protein
MRLVKIGYFLTVFCKEFAEKRSVTRLQTDLSKVFGYWEKKYVLFLHFAERVFFDYSDAIFITKTFAM